MKAKTPTNLRKNAPRNHHKVLGVSADLPPDTPLPPDYLSDSAKAEWLFIVKCFEKYGLLTLADSALLELYSRYMAKWREAMSIVEKEGLLTKSGKINPMLTACNNMMNHIQKLLVQLGLTPSARNAIRVTDPKEDIPESFKEFLQN